MLNFVVLAFTFLEKFDWKPPEASFSAVFSNFDKCRAEEADDVISSMAVGQVGIDVRAKFGDCNLSIVRIIRLYGRLVP